MGVGGGVRFLPYVKMHIGVCEKLHYQIKVDVVYSVMRRLSQCQRANRHQTRVADIKSESSSVYY